MRRKGAGWRLSFEKNGFDSFVGFVKKEKNSNEKSIVLFSCLDGFGWLSEG